MVVEFQYQQSLFTFPPLNCVLTNFNRQFLEHLSRTVIKVILKCTSINASSFMQVIKQTDGDPPGDILFYLRPALMD